MAERVHVRLHIGGRIKREDAQTLLELLAAKGFEIDTQTPGFVTLVAAETDVDALAGSPPLNAYEVRYGDVSAITKFCADKGLDYHQLTDACGGEDPVLYRRVGGEERTLPGHNGQAMIPIADVLEVETLAKGLGDLIANARWWTAPIQPLVIEE